MKSEVSRNVLLIILAVRLQRLVKNLPPEHRSPERITRESLAEHFISLGLYDDREDDQKIHEAARKRAERYLDEMDRIFGLEGSEKSGYVMAKRFDRFRDMFQFWLEEITPPGRHDRRLHVMLKGLIHAIDNAFSNDPISVPRLARALKREYGLKNVRDTREPLNELFDNTYVASWLQLIEEDDEKLAIEPEMDPLLLRRRPLREVGPNADLSINLARPGRIHAIFETTVADLDANRRDLCQAVAADVRDSMIWSREEQSWLPYLLYREGAEGSLMLTLWNLDEQQFADWRLDELRDKPQAVRPYVPFGLDEAVWMSFREMLD